MQRSPSEALDLARMEHLDGAVLDVNLGGETVWPVAGALAARGVPVVLATGYDEGTIPPDHAHLPRCEKPVDAHAVPRALARAISGRSLAEARSGPRGVS